MTNGTSCATRQGAPLESSSAGTRGTASHRTGPATDTRTVLTAATRPFATSPAARRSSSVTTLIAYRSEDMLNSKQMAFIRNQACNKVSFLMLRSDGSATESATAVTAATRRTVTNGHVTPSTSLLAIQECASPPGENQNCK